MNRMTEHGAITGARVDRQGERFVERFRHAVYIRAQPPSSKCKVAHSPCGLRNPSPAGYLPPVQSSAKSRRRWFGTLCVLGALGMLLLGQTRLEGRLTGLGFVGYWLLCLVLTLLAMLTALVDVFAVRRESRERQRELIESTIEEIQVRQKHRPGSE